MRYRSMRDGAIADVGRAIAMAAGGVIAFAPIEYVLTLWAYTGPLGLESKLRLVALTVTLSIWLWLVLAIMTAVAMVVTRFVRGGFDARVARDRGWFVAAD